MGVDVILGLQWGDEGKGKIVDYLADRYDLVCRFQGGPNAGHTIIIGEDKYVLHTVPSGIFRENIINVIGNGVVLDPITFQREISNLVEANIPFQDRLLIAKKAHLILPTHRYLDAASEASKGKEKIGSTLKGIGPTYMDKTGRNGLRTGDIFLPDFKKRYESLKSKHLRLIKMYDEVEFALEEEEKKWFDAIEKLKQFKQINCEYYLNEALSNGKKILAEGAQGSMLDIDFGTYPFVTSSNTITAGVCTGLGVSPQKIGEVIGITKAYCTRVGSGPFPSELFDDNGAELARVGHEFGATTGRPRRCGWIDLPQLKYTIMINGVTQLVVTKLDVMNMFKEIGVGESYNVEGETSFELPYDMVSVDTKINIKTFKGWECDLDGVTKREDFPKEAKEYLDALEQYLNVSISMVSTGPQRSKLVAQ